MAVSAKSTSKLKELGAGLLQAFPEGVAAFLMVHYSEALPLKEVWRGGAEGVATGGDGKRVLSICCKRQRAVLIHDADKDPQMRGTKVRTFRSALCVPVFGEAKELLGALFLAAAEPGVFDKEHRYAVERTARDFAQPLTTVRRVPEQKSGESEGHQLDFLASPLVLASLAFAALLFMTWLLAPASKTPEPRASVAAPVLDTQAQDVAKSFLEDLRGRDYEGAWSKLSRTLKARWSPQDFAEEVQAWIEDGVDREEVLAMRSISRVQRHHRRTQVMLLESSVSGDRGQWVWELEYLDGEWLVVSLSGPVRSPRKP